MSQLIYLASQSHRRHQIMKSMKIPFKVVPSTYQERAIKNIQPDDLVMRHAFGKASKAVLPKKARYVLGSDTMVWCKDRALGKPKTMKEAREMLQMMSGSKHEVYTGIALIDRKEQDGWVDYDCTEVRFKKLSKTAIDDYLQKVNPFDKAGSYAIQKGPKIVASYEGSYSNVMGLPRELLRSILKEMVH